MATDFHHVFIERFKVSAASDARITAAFVGGSRAAGTADAYADVDLYLIVRDDDYPGFFAERSTFMEQLGPPLLLEDFNGFGFDMLLFIYPDGIDGELVLRRESEVAQAASGAIQVLVDRKGILPPEGFPPPQQPAESEQREYLRWMVSWFWRDLSQFNRWMARDQLWTAYGHLATMRLTCLGLTRLKHAFISANETYFKIEQAADEADLAQFQRTFCPVERASLLHAAHCLIEIYEQIARPLAAAHGVSYPVDLQRVVTHQFEQISGRGCD